MTHKYTNIYNNLIKLTRNKNLFKNIENNDLFSDRLFLFLLHFGFFLKYFKKYATKKEIQEIYDYIFKEIEFAKKETKPIYNNNSFMYEFLTSFRDKINAPFKKKDK